MLINLSQKIQPPWPYSTLHAKNIWRPKSSEDGLPHLVNTSLLKYAVFTKWITPSESWINHTLKAVHLYSTAIVMQQMQYLTLMFKMYSL